MTLKTLIAHLNTIAKDHPEMLDAEITTAPIRDATHVGGIGGTPEDRKPAKKHFRMANPREQRKIFTVEGFHSYEPPEGDYVIFGFEIETELEVDPDTEFVN